MLTFVKKDQFLSSSLAARVQRDRVGAVNPWWGTRQRLNRTIPLFRLSIITSLSILRTIPVYSKSHRLSSFGCAMTKLPDETFIWPFLGSDYDMKVRLNCCSIVLPTSCAIVMYNILSFVTILVSSVLYTQCSLSRETLGLHPLNQRLKRRIPNVWRRTKSCTNFPIDLIMLLHEHV